MATKRAATDSGVGGPPAKKLSLTMSPLDIGPAAGEDDLDIKVLQVQNKKLGERLRERNRHREQLETQLEKMEEMKENYLKLQVTLKQQFLGLRECLSVAMVPLDGGGDCVMSEEEVEKVAEAETLRTVMRSIHRCVQMLCRTRNSGDENLSGDTAQDLRAQSVKVLDQIAKQHTGQLQPHTQLQETVALLEAKCEQLQEDLANARFSLEQSQTRGDRLESRLEAVLVELHTRPALQTQASEEGGAQSTDDRQEGSAAPSTASAADAGAPATDSEEVETLQGHLQDAKEVAASRQEEITRLSSQLLEAKKEIDQLKFEQQNIAESAIKESAPYKVLQSQFSIAALEAAQLRACLAEAKGLLTSARQQYFSQLEEIRIEEGKYKLEVREEMTALENTLAAVKHDYEVLLIDFERTVASNEQAAPIAKELQVTVESLQKTISQHKSEVNRYKVRAHKAEQQLAKEEKERDTKEKSAVSADKEVTSDPITVDNSGAGADKVAEEKSMEKVRAEVKALGMDLEGYKEAASPEVREKAEIIAAEKKARSQVEELKKRFEDYRRDYEKRKEHIREDAARKTKSLTEDNRHLQKDLSAKKHEAQALVAEMECTAQAFEEMQEQNLRLLQQLKEKDDANFKLMSERIKSNSMSKLLLEDKELLHSQLSDLLTEKQRHVELMTQMEERDRSTEATFQGLDRELALQQQANEAHRKKAEESLQEQAQLQFQMADKQKLIESVVESLSCKADECEKESQLHRKSVEEIAALKRKLEKYKTREWMSAGDEVLLEEIKMYKAKLNCPCCSARKKDTVLTKCFHVFCSECIRSRYDSRLRKCPKCGAAFGANDFHKIYLS